ncbi:SGNH/GDSL hydrolase family protein [Allosaccharopolyspora coralli]|uniref:SGNH/GDSL hydrolase family protein n=1 Tax=Allosaccharopolyspora coralli TaxID=2665642 RepID=A0A5Q3QCH5_9PSEU|nr:SGNH/GDSL hydrolase family protein [Allosaccharopolyspora coralli]QGK68507.1 SGNH/GDSL hydrolase family protein [Allosaccharopolyspora coralli]
MRRNGVPEHPWRSLVALGDSFTEGMDDPGPDGGVRGWADRLAERLDAGTSGFRYANLAVRGKLLHQVIEDQVPRAVSAEPDVVALTAGGNDLIRPSGDPDALAAQLDHAVATLRASGAQVLVGTGFDPRERPVMRRVRGRVGTYNSHVHAIAAHHGCLVLDLWSMPVLQDSRAWSDDRLHLAPEGHRRVALRACEALGVPVDADWREPLPPGREQTWQVQRAGDLHWVRHHLAPWIGRRLQGRSSGDGRRPKRPDLRELVPGSEGR